ncbi:MAG: acyl-CoA reductase, partial [Candidatus Methanoculleus thermohydrogenotrophicum]
MIRCHLLNGEFGDREFNDFTTIADVIDHNRRYLQEMPLDVIIELLARLGKKLIQNPDLNSLPGVGYLSIWLRRKNLEQICRINYGDCRYLDTFVPVNNHFEMSAQPRGIVCQWVAANIPTLAFFSLAQAILSKNGSIAKVPEENRALITAILKELSDTAISCNGTT